MDPVAFSRVAFPFAAVLFITLVVVLPIWRLYRRTGVFAVTAARSRDPMERLMAAGLAVCIVFLVGSVIGYSLYGPARVWVWPTLPWVTWSGWVVMLLALVMVVSAQAQMGKSWRIGIEADGNTELITHGLFRFVRNPIYSGIFLFLLGLVLIAPSAPIALASGVLATAIAVQTRREEAHLLAAHGDAFVRWASKVGRFVPGIGRIGR